MEFEFSNFISLFSFMVFVFLLQKLVTRSKTTLNLPPGPRKLPFIGNLHYLLSSDPPHRILRDLSMKYGPLMHLKLGEVSSVVVSSAEVAKQIMKTHDAVFASRPSLFAAEYVFYGGRDIGFAPCGEHWRQMRKICTMELLSAKRVQSFRSLRETEFSNLCKWIASNAGSTINFTGKIGLTIYDCTTKASIGKKINEQALFISLTKQALELVAGFNLVDLFPSIKLLSRIGGLKKKIERVHRELDRMLDNIIDQHKLSTSLNIEVDLLDVLMTCLDDSKLHLTKNVIKAVLFDVFIAGVETSVTTVDWAMAEMLKNPTILRAAQDEVRQVFDSKGFVDESSFDELNYLKLVIKETLRIHPPGPMLVPRESVEQCEIDGYQIPVKTRILVNTWAIGRDPKYWDDPESFKPDRFLEKPVDYKGNDFEYIPFGAGRRICPGITLGLAHVELPLAMCLYHFDWALPNKMKPEELDMTEHFGLTARRTKELHLVPVVRRPVPFG